MNMTLEPVGCLDATHALTVWQPWTSLIALGFKPYEFRGWPAPKSFAGRRNAIHAARPAWHAEEVKVITRDPERTCFRGGGATAARKFAMSVLQGAAVVPLGAFPGTVALGEPRRAIDLACASGEPDDVDPDIWDWPVLMPRRVCKIIPVRGRKGFLSCAKFQGSKSEEQI
jgi:hypothetical protein